MLHSGIHHGRPDFLVKLGILLPCNEQDVKESSIEILRVELALGASLVPGKPIVRPSMFMNRTIRSQQSNRHSGEYGDMREGGKQPGMTGRIRLTQPAIVAAVLARVHGESPDNSLQQLMTGYPHDLSPPLWSDVKNVYNGLVD